MQLNYKIYFQKVIKLLIGLIIGIILVLVLIPFFFKETIDTELKKLINENVEGNVNFSSTSLSFFEHFPSLTASLYHVNLKGAKPFEDSTLLIADQISLGVNVLSLFQSRIEIEKLIITKAELNLLVDSTGASNYALYKSSSEDTDSVEEPLNLNFNHIQFIDSDIHYLDQSIPLEIGAKGFNYVGKGDFSSNIFDLHTKAQIEQFSFRLDTEEYLHKKRVEADLITQINTDSLGFIFERNDLKINELPVRFKGHFTFIPNGYHIDFKLKSKESTLSELLSLVPKNYQNWIQDLKIKGTSEVFLNLVGDYKVSENLKPDLTLGLIINDGFIAYKKARVPVDELNTKMKLHLPSLTLDSLKVELKQFDFKLSDGYFKSCGNVTGYTTLNIKSEVKSNLNLNALSDAIQWPEYSFGGQFKLDAKVDGNFSKNNETIISIPHFKIENSLENGYFKWAKLDSPIEKITYKLEGKSSSSDIKKVKFELENLELSALQNSIKGFAKIENLEKPFVDANIKAFMDLSSINKFYPIDSFDIAGNINVDLLAKGIYNLEKKQFPITTTQIQVDKGYIKSWAYPIPLENIQVEAKVNSKSNSLRDLSVQILPISFTLSDEPFMIKADFKNFNDIKYSIKSKGKLHLEPIYKIFAIEGLNVKGYVNTNLDLQGVQSDALKGNFEKLRNRGKLEIGNIYVQTAYLDQPLIVNKGIFSFEKEKLKFDKVLAKYQTNEVEIKGYVDNILKYVSESSDTLKGKFELNARSIIIDDFMTTTSTESTSSSDGLVIIPKEWNIEVLAKAGKVKYDNVILSNFNGQLEMNKGRLILNTTAFQLAGAQTEMNGWYEPISEKRAQFEYGISASDFDIKKAYNEVPIFREMMTSAQNMLGKVSLQYQLKGQLNKDMEVVYPSIEGNGVLTLKDIQFKGFKLLSGISKATGKEDFKNGSVKDVNIKTSIKNNVMTIERTKMKMAGFRPRFEGQVTLDGKLNIGLRLGLPPLGIIGIPLQITGTSENYDIKLGKYQEEDLEEEDI